MKRKDVKVKVITRAGRENFVLRWTDANGKSREKSTGIRACSRNKRQAEHEALSLQKRLNAHGGQIPLRDFDHRYTTQHLSGLSAASRRQWRTAMEHVYSAGIETLEELNSSSISQIANTMRTGGLSEPSIQSYLATIKAGLSWAAQIEIIDRVPRFPRLRRAKGKSKRMRGRPLRAEEFERMLYAAEKLRRSDCEQWKQLLVALWLSGLRLDESLRLSWDSTETFRVDVSGKYPVYRISADGEKGHRDRLLPIVPEFSNWLLALPHRKGKVLSIRKAMRTCCRWVSRFGEQAGIIVDADGRTASANDLRRSFAARWAVKVTPAELQQLMRHQSIETTMSYYVDLDTETLAERLHESLGDKTGDKVDSLALNQDAKDRSEI